MVKNVQTTTSVKLILFIIIQYKPKQVQ